MLRSLSRHMRQNAVAWLALFVALGGTSAYAVNTVGSTDIIDGQVKSVDVGDGEILSADVKDQSLTTFDVSTFLGADVVDGTLTSADIQDGSLGNGDFLDQSVDSRVVTNNSLQSSDLSTASVGSDEVANNSLGNGDFLTGSVDSRVATDDSLTGTDINEASLNLPPTTTARFAGQGSIALPNDNASFTTVVASTLPAGSYAIAATANIVMPAVSDTRNRTTQCELRNHNGAFIGGGRNVGQLGGGVEGTLSLSMNGGVTVPAGGGQVGVYCRHIVPGFAVNAVADAQMMIVRLDGFF